MKEDSSSKKSTMSVHMGQVLLRVAGLYSTLEAVILELVQNGLDVNAREIFIGVDFRTRTLTVTDDGDGVSEAEFDHALETIGISKKERTKLGRYGIGLIAALGKCHRYTFTSVPRGSQGYREWHFVTSEIAVQQSNVQIPNKPSEYVFKPGGDRANEVSWRTRAQLKGFTADSIISRLDMESLVAQIQAKFGRVLQRNQVKVQVAIIGPTGVQQEKVFSNGGYEGEPLPVWQRKGKKAGEVRIEFYRLTQLKRGKIKIDFGEADSDFRISFSQFNRSAGEWLSDEVRRALESGTFQGEITASLINLEPSRTKFVENDALVDLCETIELWYKEVGSKLLAEAQEVREEGRFQQLGRQALRTIDELLRDPAFAGLREAIKKLRAGTIAVGHKQAADGQVIAVQPYKSVSVEGEHHSHGNEASGEHRETQTEKPGHIPLSVSGPSGQRRVVVRSSSFGLQLVYDRMPGSTKLWDMDETSGIITINVRHPVWAACERSDTELLNLHWVIITHALTLNSMQEGWREIARIALDNSLDAQFFCRSQPPAKPPVKAKSAKGAKVSKPTGRRAVTKPVTA